MDESRKHAHQKKKKQNQTDAKESVCGGSIEMKF